MAADKKCPQLKRQTITPGSPVWDQTGDLVVGKQRSYNCANHARPKITNVINLILQKLQNTLGEKAVQSVSIALVYSVI